ncbi:MAG: sugar phosphate isomerase/epimerase [Ruminococcaceae bacterium]|nr:sugar phosphate isomerase/epimerase [Oscillospiraceae bacterium]
MKLATTTSDFLHFCDNDPDRVTEVARAGFKHIDLNLYDGICPEWIYFSEGWKDEVARLRERADAFGADFVQAHSPGGNPLDFGEKYELLVRSTIRSIEICAELGIKNTVFHTGYSDAFGYTPEGKRGYFEENMKFIRRLLPTAERCGVTLLIENSTRANMKDKYFFLTGEDMAEFIEFASHPLIGACWDTGHANVEGHQYGDLVALGDKLRGLHVNDNRSKRDEHMMPYMGSLSVDELMCGLIDSGYKGYFTFESSSTLIPPRYWLSKRHTFERDTRCLRPTLEMARLTERLMYEIGKHILSQYNCFEE